MFDTKNLLNNYRTKIKDNTEQNIGGGTEWFQNESQWTRSYTYDETGHT